jgi:hypothetical protein
MTEIPPEETTWRANAVAVGTLKILSNDRYLPPTSLEPEYKVLTIQ